MGQRKVIDEDMDYKQTEHYIRQSPPHHQHKHNPAKGRENQSPTSSIYDRPLHGAPSSSQDPILNESFNFLKFQNQNQNANGNGKRQGLHGPT